MLINALVMKRLAPVMTFVLLWTVAVLEGINWKYFDERVAVFLLVPVLLTFILLIVKEVLNHNEKTVGMRKHGHVP